VGRKYHKQETTEIMKKNPKLVKKKAVDSFEIKKIKRSDKPHGGIS